MYSEDELKKRGIDSGTAGLLDYKKERMERQKKMLELQKIEKELVPLVQEMQFKKQRFLELQALLKRLETEAVRSRQDLDRQKREEDAVNKNLKKEQAGLGEEESKFGKELKDVEEQIQKEKDVIKEHEVKLVALEKRANDLKGGSDKTERREKSIISRLISVFEREKRETQRAEELFKTFSLRRDNARAEMDQLNKDITNLQYRLSAIQRKLTK